MEYFSKMEQSLQVIIEIPLGPVPKVERSQAIIIHSPSTYHVLRVSPIPCHVLWSDPVKRDFPWTRVRHSISVQFPEEDIHWIGNEDFQF